MFQTVIQGGGDIVGTENHEKIKESFVCCNAILKYTIILRKMLLDEEFEHTVIVSLTKSKKLSTLEY